MPKQAVNNHYNADGIFTMHTWRPIRSATLNAWNQKDLGVRIEILNQEVAVTVM